MDTDIALWIIEFLLRQNSLDDRLLNDLIRVLPLPNNNPTLKKSLILRKLESDTATGTISERTLQFIEQIEELDHTEGNTEVSEAMKAAYCAVAVHCTAKFIEDNVDDNKTDYFSAVRRIWRGRVREMEKFDVGKRIGLVSDGLLTWMDDIEAGVWVASVCENVLVKYKGLNALEAVRGYVIEAKEKMGPSFLEAAAETLSDEASREIVGLGKDEEGIDLVEDVAPVVALNGDQDADTDASNKDNEACKANALSRRKQIAPRRHRGAKVVDPEANDDVVVAHNRVGVDAPGALRDTNGEPLHANKDNLDFGFIRDQNKGPKINLMERNSTAHTIEWNESIDNSNKGSPGRSHSPISKKRAVSPLKTYEDKKLSKRKKKKRWSNIEEDTLRTGVIKYGKGNWKLILNMYSNVFIDRTEVDLKDKWRNLIR